ncbi:heparan sulfate glucosamine 3-O-sulfotransferase 5-like [Patiria miniata]|uniref:Sulfotransferase domain-containing protein n=1 Tax=Patiria miniata TaxID=46514 RepID=A0A913ZCJ2_PATMI|nr:heparan sulfate glucosamine 3-O-sulfotransferase 5-like [Patiria miniata]
MRITFTMSSINLKTKGAVFLLCLASFTLGHLLVVFEPDQWFVYQRWGGVAPVSRFDVAKIKSRYEKESDIGSAGSDRDNPSEKISAADAEIEETGGKSVWTIYEAKHVNHDEKIPGLDSETDEKNDRAEEAIINENVEDETAIVKDEKVIGSVKDETAIAKDNTAIVKDDTAIVKDEKVIVKESPPVRLYIPKTKPVALPNPLRTGGRYSITSSQLLGNALRFMSPDVKASFANITGLKYDKQKATVIWPNLNDQKKWAVLRAGMRKLGYEQRLPTVICLGVKKGGTTAFLYYLVQHPQIARALLEEIHYFSIDYERGIDYYRSRMGFSSRNMLQFEKSPSYFIFQNVPKRMLKDLPPNVKFVVCVRDPVERTISDFRHEYELKLNRNPSMARGETPATQAKHFVERIFSRYGEVDMSKGLTRESVYSMHFKRWLQSFPRDRFYILSHERVDKDLYGELKNLEKFLGLESFYKRSMFYYDEKRQAPCMRSGCPHPSTPGFLPKADLGPDVIQQLRDFFRPYNQEFAQLTQMNFSWTNL